VLGKWFVPAAARTDTMGEDKLGIQPDCRCRHKQDRFRLGLSASTEQTESFMVCRAASRPPLFRISATEVKKQTGVPMLYSHP